MQRQMLEEKFMRFPEGRSKAVSFSYDDGVKADKKLLEIFNKYGLKGTFNLNSALWDCENWHGRMDERETYETFKNCGQEIALHGARHIFLNKVPPAEAVREIAENRLYLEEKFGCIVRGMAYAYNGYNAEIIKFLKSLGVAYARTTESSYSFDIPEDWFRLKPTCHHGDGRLSELTEKFLNAKPEAEFKNRDPLLFYIWGHSYEFDDNDDWEIIETLAKRVSGSKDIWFATGYEIYSYVTAYERLVFSMDGERVFNPSHIPVWLDIRGKTYKIESGKEIKFG